MTGIEVAAAVTSILAVAVFGSTIWQLCKADDRSWLLCLTILGLPMSMLTYYGVRLPIDAALKQWLGEGSPLLAVCQLCYAPVTEEPAKLIPLFIAWPIFRRPISNENRVPIAMSLGLGFAIGEIWLVARFIANLPDLADVPFHQFGGFLNERLATCIAHPGFTILAVWGLQRGGVRSVLGLFAAMTFHFLSNFPIFLMNVDFGNFGKPTWTILVSLWLLITVIASAVILGIMHAGSKRLFHVITTGMVRCPECGEIYKQPILGGNFGLWRYEPCARCHKWHWISLKDIH